MKVSVLIPVYNNSNSLELLQDRLLAVFNDYPFKNIGREIIFINDGSTDNSSEIITKYWSNKTVGFEVKQINFTRNFGQVSAILCGVKEATGDCVATLSADLQDPPELIIEMFEGWKSGTQVNLGYRKIRADGWLNRFFSALFYFIIQNYYPSLPIGGFDYVLLDRKVIENLTTIDYKNRFLQGDIINLGYSMRWYNYKRDQPAGKSHRSFNPFKIKYFIDSIFHTKFLISFLFIESLIIVIAGFTTVSLHYILPDVNCLIIGLVILLFGILNMSFTAVVAYLWRIYNDMKIYPDYIIRNVKLL